MSAPKREFGIATLVNARGLASRLRCVLISRWKNRRRAAYQMRDLRTPRTGNKEEAVKTSTKQLRVKTGPEPGLVVAIADAECAAETAARSAASASTWASRAGVGEDDANEAMRAAMRARVAASRASLANVADDAWSAALEAWAAATSAREADARVVSAIAGAISTVH
jgi:hypothetical protein